MRLNRIYCPGPLALGAEVELPAAGAAHVARVLRMRTGARLGIFDGAGAEFRGEIVRLAAAQVIVHLDERAAAVPESPLSITLVQGISRGERMDWTLQKATELGVAAIAPVLTARSVVRLDEKQAHKRQIHWRSITIAACEQCGRAKVPEVHAPVSLREHLASAASSDMETLRLALSPDAPVSLAGLQSVPRRIELLSGPEGGLADEELLAARAAGFMPVRLGPRVLRTETAAVVALSVLQASWGDLQ